MQSTIELFRSVHFHRKLKAISQVRNLSKSESYHAKKSKKDKRKIGHYRGPDVMAHELLGHGYDWANDIGRDEGKARELGNKIRACLGNNQPQRVNGFLDYIISSD